MRDYFREFLINPNRAHLGNVATGNPPSKIAGNGKSAPLRVHLAWAGGTALAAGLAWKLSKWHTAFEEHSPS